MGFKGNVLFFKFRVIEMAPRTKTLASNPDDLSLSEGPAWNLSQLYYDLYVYTRDKQHPHRSKRTL